jgi:hypothetical protein
MPSGTDAVAALSMDGVKIQSGHEVQVTLRSENWVDDFMQRLGKMFETEEEVITNNLAVMNLNVDGSSLKLFNPRIPLFFRRRRRFVGERRKRRGHLANILCIPIISTNGF